MRRLIAFALFAFSLPLGAQSASNVVSPGMSRAKVVSALGKPATERTVAEFTYLFYLNSCGKVRHERPRRAARRQRRGRDLPFAESQVHGDQQLAGADLATAGRATGEQDRARFAHRTTL
jgi:hypothetical protein